MPDARRPAAGTGAPAGRAPDSLPRVGVEEEFFLLDPRSGRPVDRAAEVLAAARAAGGTDRGGAGGEGRGEGVDPGALQAEVLRAQVETASPVCSSLAELGDHLRASRRQLARAAEEGGAALAAVGAAPVGGPDPSITPSRRYLAMQASVPVLLSEQLINGMHVHVEVPGRAAGVEVMNRLRPHLHLLLALAANSPFWRGRDTGCASWRSVHAQRWPVEGVPPVFGDEEDYEQRVETLLSTGVILDRAMLYWQVRLSERYPTVEVRVADVALDVPTAVAAAGLVRALVARALDDARAGRPVPQVPAELVRAASWQAAHDGLGGDLVDLGTPPRPALRPAADAVLDLVATACGGLPTAEAALIEGGVRAVLADGGGAQRQRQAYAAGGMSALLDVIRQTSDL